MKTPTELRRDISIWTAFHASMRITLWLVVAGVLLGIAWCALAAAAMNAEERSRYITYLTN